jgi:uncharacterized DUF497 family protein
VEFEWDPAKCDRCLRERGFAFADVLPAFADPHHLVEPDLRFDYGEERYQLYGHVRERRYVIVFTRGGPAFRIISARKANAREQRHARAAGT